jgi:hypothetical protein
MVEEVISAERKELQASIRITSQGDLLNVLSGQRRPLAP